MKAIRIHYIQHVAFEGLGYIETWAEKNGHILSATKLYEKVIFPEEKDYDWLIVMGGPMGVYQEDKYFWLAKEKAFIKSAITSKKIVLGICLGAQLIAEVLGAKVYPNNTKEIGWFPVSLTPDGEKHPLFADFYNTFPVLHWHGDTFELPRNTVHLMQTDVCANQAFLYNNKVLGLQFHLEATYATITAMVKHCLDELIIDKFVHDGNQILVGSEHCKQTNKQLDILLNRLVKL